MIPWGVSMKIPQDIRETLEPDESVIWSDKPLRTPFILKGIVFAIIGIPWIALPLIIIIKASPKILLNPEILLFMIFWYGISILVFFASPLYSLLVWKNVYYVLTNRRLIVRKGLVGIDYDTLNLDLIQQVNLNVGFWDKKYGTGTLIVQATGVRPISLYAVREPRKVYEVINRAVREIKEHS